MRTPLVTAPATLSFPLVQITHVTTQHGWRGSTLIVDAGGKPVRLRNVAPVERTDEFAQYIRRRSGTGDGPAPAAVILPPQADVVALLTSAATASLLACSWSRPRNDERYVPW